jgi:PAS domain S-box-containing protein
LQLFRRQSPPSIRSKLVILVLACALPILIGYIWFARDAARREHAHIERDAMTVAETLAAAVDRDLDSGETAVQVLAHSSLLARGDLAGFHARARRLLRPEFPAYAFVLTAPDGRTLLHTRYAFGAVPPPHGNEAQIQRVFASGDTLTSGLHRADPSQPFVFSVVVPVWQDGKVAYALSVLLRPKRLGDLLASQHLPENWVAEVFDSQQLIVARSVDLTRHIGERMGARLAARASAGKAGVAARDEGGERRFSAFAHTSDNWTVTVDFPATAARDLLGHSEGAIAAGIALLLGVSLVLAWVIGGSIARAVSALTEPAAALGRGEPLAIPALPLREAAAVATELQKVEQELVGYRTGLETLVAERTAELERSNILLETVYASAPVGLCFMNADMRFVMVNDYLAAINAVPASAHVGRTLPEILGEAGAGFEHNYRRVLASGRPLVDVESSGEVPRAPGVTRHWISSYYPVYGPGREVAGVNAVVLDITERKLQEQRNRDNEELFRALFEGSSDAQVLVAYGAGFVSANQAAATLFGCASIDEFLTLSPVSTSPEYQPNGRRSDELALEHMRQTLDTGVAHFEWLHQRRDGSNLHADVMLTRVDIGGRGMMQGTIRDISERVRAEAALRATGQRLAERERFIRTVTDHLPALVGYWDASLRCQFANRPYLEWLGRAEHDVIGQEAATLIGADQMAQVQPYLRDVLQGRRQSFSRRLQREHGPTIEALANYIPDLDELGQVRGFYMLQADVTELKRTEERLVQALRAAEEASRVKGEFLANMSHEIRTPMNAILGLARLLEEARLGQRERGYIGHMKTAARALLGMLNDVLDFSRVDSGLLALENTPFELSEVLGSIAVLAAANAWAKGVEPVFAVDPAVPAQLVGDPMRLQQILLNLMGNAVKFTEHGEVVLSIRLLGRDGDRVRLGFAVRDTGIGITPEQQGRLFQAFSQGDSSISRKYGGTGLGLAISRRLVELKGGTLRVESEPGRGAQFSFEVSYQAAAEALALPRLPRLRVLVADDNRSACAALAESCAGLGWEVDRAHGGVEALALLRGKRRYDLAFLDSEMPDLDGATVLEYARADQAIALPRCALVAAEPECERLAALGGELGIEAILAKPFPPARLHETARQLLGTPAPQPARSAPVAGRLQGLRILLVEDNVINQEVAHYILAHAGAQLEIAGNGQAAVSLLAEGARFDAVLMDLQMPVMNGFEATMAIRAMGLATLPIVAMTANAMDEDRRRALAAGMDAHLSKPIDVDELIGTLARLTGKPHAPALAPAAPPAMPALLAPPSIPGIDLKATLPRFGGSFENFAAVFRRLDSSQGGTLGEVRALLRSGERHGAQQLVHRLRGVAANLGATDVAALALDLEGALRSADEAALALKVARLDSALQVVLQAARELDGPGHGVEPAPQGATGTLVPREELARLLELLTSNNLKAKAQFESLRPALPTGPALELADAVGTLRFDVAARLVREIMKGEEEA